MKYLVFCRLKGAVGAPWLELPKAFDDERVALLAAYRARLRFNLLTFAVRRADRAAAFLKGSKQ